MSKIDFQRMASLVASFPRDRFLADDMLRQQLTIAAERDLSVVWHRSSTSARLLALFSLGYAPVVLRRRTA